MRFWLFFFFSLLGLLLIGRAFFSHSDSRSSFLMGQDKLLASILISGEPIPFSFTSGMTVRAALSLAGFSLADDDTLFPGSDTTLTPGTIISWIPRRKVTVNVENQKQEVRVLGETSEAILEETGIPFDEDDLITPSRGTTVASGETIILTKVEVREETKEVAIPYTTKEKEDDELSWRKRIVQVKGVDGIKRTTYRVSYHNGKEVARKMISAEVVEDPIAEVVTQGTYVKVGKSHRGAASWYAYTGTMAAANPWLPLGSYVRVTNLDNEKSVIVKINDRGPFAPGRIIDLDKVAFQQIASLGAGVINVKMEEIVN